MKRNQIYSWCRKEDLKIVAKNSDSDRDKQRERGKDYKDKSWIEDELFEKIKITTCLVKSKPKQKYIIPLLSPHKLEQ